MNTVYLLGAGASHELKFTSSTYDGGYGTHLKQHHSIHGPLSAGFFYYANQFAKETAKFATFPVEFKIHDQWLIKFISDHYGATIQDLFENIDVSKRVNIEQLYSMIEHELEAISRGSGNNSASDLQKYAEVYFGWKDLIEFIYDTLSVIPYFCYSLYHRILAHWVVQTGAHVVSFNWDTLFDDELYRTKNWDFADGYGFSPVGFIDKSEAMKLKNQRYQRRDVTSKNFVLKPHGSINWYKLVSNPRVEYDYDSMFIHIGIPLTSEGFWRSGTTPRQGTLRFMEAGSNKTYFEGLIIPPGVKRKAFQHLWNRIKMLLAEADEIVAIGFSLNNFDRHVVDEFQQIRPMKKPALKIVNPDNSVLSRYQELFPYAQCSKIFGSFGDYCRWIVQQSGMERFAELSNEIFGNSMAAN